MSAARRHLGLLANATAGSVSTFNPALEAAVFTIGR